MGFVPADRIAATKAAVGSCLSALTRNQVVAFQADQVDSETGVVNSVVVVGGTEIVSDRDESLARIEPIRRPWQHGWLDHVIKVRVQYLTGRKLVLPEHLSTGWVGSSAADLAPAPPAELNLRECWTRLRTASLGRVVFIEDAMPAVRMAAFTAEHDEDGRGDHLVLRSPHDDPIGVRRDEIVAFEIDDVDASARRGWSVVALGRVESVDQVIRIRIVQLSGRRVPAGRPAPGRW